MLTLTRPAILAPPLVITAALSFGGCTLRGNGTEVVDIRELEPFEAIDLGGAFELVVHVEDGVTQHVEVSGDENVVPKIVTEVSNGELSVSVDHWMVRPKQPMKLELTLPRLRSIDASGASKIEVEGLNEDRFELELSGASDSTLAGTVVVFEVDSSGASKLDARSLAADTVDIDLSGAGDAEVWASEVLDAEISGAGKLRYWGEPARVNEDVSGAGSIEPAQ